MKSYNNYVVDYIAKTYNNNKKMSCTQYGFTIQGDVNEKLAKSVVAVAGTDYAKQQVLAGYFNTPEFQEYVNKETELRNYVDVNANTMRRLLSSFFVSRHATIINTTNRKNADALNGFSSAKAKTVAKEHIANLVLETYYNNKSKPKAERIDREAIIRDVSKNVNTTFNNNVAVPLVKRVKAENDNKSALSIVDKITSVNDEIKQLNAKRKAIIQQYNETNDISKKDIMDITLDAISKELNIKDAERYSLFKNLIDVAGNIREKNFSNLTSQIRGNTNEFFKSVFNSSKLINIADEFKVTLENDKIIERNYADENDVVNPNSDSVDEMAKSWEDTLYGSFDRHVSPDLKLYFNRLYKLSAPTELGNNTYQYDDNNELGVPMTMGANFIIAQITNYANFYSLDDFINNISKISKINPSLYGLSKLANDMYNDRVFANKVFTQLANPRIAKTIVTIGEDGVNIDQSNKSADPLSHLVYNMINSIKSTYKNSFDINDKYNIRNNIMSLTKATDNNVFYNGELIKSLDKYITDTLLKYFPKTEINAVYNYLHSNPDNAINIYRSMLQDISNLVNSTESIIDDYNEKYGEFSKKYSDWAKKKRIAAEGGDIDFNTPIPVFDYSAINYNKLYPSIINIGKNLVNYSSIKNELNSINAEGNMASDLIGNNFITNLLKQIQFGTTEQANKGLENLKDFITQSPQYQYSPFYFGVKDERGNILSEGLFNRDITGKVTVNPNARNMINISLFDGVKDSNNSKSTMYSGMSTGDYFITQLNVFNQPINYITSTGSIANSAGYFMRTPSDAPKNFIFQGPKYDTGNLWNVVNSSRTQYIEDVQQELAKKHKFTTDGEFETVSENIILGNVKGKLSNNYISAEDIYNILQNPVENKAYNNLYNIYDEQTGIVSIPMIYSKGDNILIVWLKGNKVKDTKNNIAENLKVQEVYNNGSKPLSDDFIIDLGDTLTTEGINNGKIERTINRNNAAFRALHSHALGELNNFINNLNNVFEKKSGKWVTKKSTNGLIDRAHFNGNEIVKDGKLTGNFFNFIRLFDTNGYKAGEDIMNSLFLYRGDNSDKREFALSEITKGNIDWDGDRFSPRPVLGIDWADIRKGKLDIVNGKESAAANKLIDAIDKARKQGGYDFTQGSGSVTNDTFVPINTNEPLLTKTTSNRLSLNINRNDLISINNNKIELSISEQNNEIINKAVEQWLNNYYNEILNRSEQYSDIVGDSFSNNDIVNWAINNAIMEMNFDDIFEGDTKFYKSAQDFLKRAKEVQAAGKAYAGFDFNNKISGDIRNIIDANGIEVPITINGKEIQKARNGFRGVTITNTVRPSKNAGLIKQELVNILTPNIGSEQANRIATEIAKGYYDNTKVNDAQSYITLEEFIARRHADGTLTEYEDLLDQLMDDNINIQDINLKGINARIQVQKNFYFDKQFDANTGTFYPRQIKNAEFVLIPKLIKGTDLEKLYNIMKANDINQVNTAETSKAAKKNILTFWDNNGVANPVDFENAIKADKGEAIENYYYQYLYKQQDVADHMVNQENKAGIQVTKKISDNASPEVQQDIDNFFKAYSANIKHDFDMLLNRMGWKVENARLVDGSGKTNANGEPMLKFDDFYKKAQVEAQRLGMDNNFIEYLTPDELGNPAMPNYMNNVSSKLESIAQSIFNNGVTRQTLPGWHAAQVTSVGHGLQTLDENGTWRELKYHPQVTLEDGTVVQEAYAEVMLPRWSTLIPKDYDINKLTQEGLDLHLGYRIPTEGKQSVSILKVVGFLDEVYGSTIMVPDEWVTQTGSDFDVDSVYAISYEMYKDKDGTIKKKQFDTSDTERDIQRRYINYINDSIEQKVDRELLTDEFITNEMNELRDSIKDLNRRQKESDEFTTLLKEENVVYNSLPVDKQNEVKQLNKRFINSNIVDRFNAISSIFEVYAEQEKNLEEKEKLQDFADYNAALAVTAQLSRETQPNQIVDFKSAKAERLKQLFEANRIDYLNKVQDVAKKANLVNYEDFSKWSIEQQNSRAARNNRILDSMMNIMRNPNSREENYSRSNFDDLTNAMKKMDALRNAGETVRSTYNPFDQIDFMGNAMSGATLKAFSVTRDTFNSVNNYIKSKLNKGHEIKVVYDLSKYNINDILNAYENVEVDNKTNTATVTHDRIANSKNNRNVVGKLVTVYSSQTTAHILDAVKEGTIFNENNFTFGTFKTLIDLGIDYDTAIAFLMQPGITRIVEANNRTKSIYTNLNNNAINSAVKGVAKDLGITIAGKPITDDTSIRSVINELSNNRDIQNAYKDLFGAIVGGKSTINVQNINLNGTMLENRLKSAEITNNSALSDIDKQYRNAAFDLAMIYNFAKYNNTTRNIEALARVSNPDRFGAKQTVRGTRTILNNIFKYRDFKNDPIGSTIMVGDKGIIDAIYPDIITQEGINIENSAYPYLAAFLKYATQPSVEANSQLFPTESQLYNDVTDTVQARLGINFTDEQYKEYKQYMISHVYSGVSYLTTPLTVNNFGLITLDNKTIQRQAENNTQYWDEEKARIFGYDVTQSSALKVEDINNPNEEEIYKYNALTPAQKVMWIQQNFKDGRGIFDFLDVNTFNQYEFKNKGFSSQSIKFSDQVDDIEEMYLAFRDSFFNKNPLVRIASIDLIKYAFVVEGFKFKKGGISKLITNDTLYSNIEDKGMNLIEAIQQQFALYSNPRETITMNFIDQFIRSHSDIVREVSIPKSIRDKQGNENTGFKFNKSLSSEGVVQITIDENNKDLLEKLTLDTEYPKDYIRVNKYINTGNRKTTLYKVKYDGQSVFLIPLNLLERNETGKFSVNNKNNIYKSYEYYDAVTDMASERGITINELLKDQNAFNEIKVLKEQFTIPRIVTKKIIESIHNPNEIIRINQFGNPVERVEINKFILDVNDYINSPVEDGANYGVIRNDNRTINAIIPNGVSVIQSIPTGDEIVSVKITKYTISQGLSKQFNYVLRGDKRADITKVKPEERKALQDAINSKSIKPILYKIERVSDEQEREDYERLRKEIDDERNNQMNAVTNLIEDFDADVVYNYTDADKVAKDIFNELNKRALSNDDRGAMKFKQTMDINGIDRTSSNSIHDNKRSIYTAAAKYYTAKSHDILSNIDSFTGVNGETYSINDPALYKHLTEFPEDYPLLVKLILDAKTFGQQFYDIFNLNIDGEDEQTSRDIQKIRNSINAVRTSSKLKTAVDLLFNDYIANNFSTNPLIRHGIIELKTTFGDTDWFDAMFSDIGELNHKQVQAVTKYVYSILNEATMITAPKAVETFNKQYEDIEKLPGSYDINNIITKEGKFINPYTDKFLEDRQNIIDAVKDAENNFGIDSIEYAKAKLARDKWRALNTQQTVISTYYNENNTLIENVLKKAPKEYIKYMALTRELYSDRRPINQLNEEEKKRRKEINREIRALSSEVNIDGFMKSDEEIYRANVIKSYIKAKKELNKEYFNYDEAEGFKDTLEYYTNIVKQYEKKNPLETLDQRLNNDKYREAYDWIQSNSIYTLDEATQKAITKAFEVLKSKDQSADTTNSAAVRKIIEKSDALDEYGNVDARKLTAEQIKQIKNLTAHKFSWGYENNAGEAILIKDVPAGLPVLKDSFYRMLRADGENSSEVNVKRIKVIGEINKLLGKAVDGNTGQINSKDLFEKLTEQELSDLAGYYRVLHNIKGNRNNKEIAKRFKANVNFMVNQEAFNREFAYAQMNLKGTKQYDTWLDIFAQTDKDGGLVVGDDGKIVPNNDLFGYIVPKDDTYIDKEKTDARNLVENDIQYVPNEYYYDALRKATAEGRFNEWYNDNHVFNPYSHKMEPLKVWTQMQVNPNGKLKGTYSYIPTYENTERTVKDEYKNPNYKQYSTNYNIESGQYNNLTKLSPKEKQMLDLLQSTINAYSTTHSMKMFAEQGFLPRRAKYEPDAKYYIKQAIGAVGLEFRNTGEKQWTDTVDYTKDFDADFDMMSLIKQKGYKERIKIEPKGTKETEEQYNKRVEDIRAQNKQIDADNLALDNAVLDKDWKHVFNDFIGKATEYNAKQNVKNSIYLLLEDLKESPAFKESSWNRGLKRDNARSSREKDAYQTVDQTNTYNLVQNWARRILFNQFKRSSKYSKYADLAQNITSAKYMIANVTGGIANVATGMSNVFGEVFAKDYFGTNDFKRGQSQYFANALTFIADMEKEKTNNLTVALTKAFDIVDFDAFNERRPNEKATETVKRVRDSLYAMQSGGEHYMQNSVLFTMLKSHRVFKDTDGQMRVGSLSNYNWELEVQTLIGLLNGRDDLLVSYKSFIKDIKSDFNELRKYDTFSKDINEEFLRDIGDKQLIKDYIAKRKEVLKTSKEEFVKNPTVESQYELVDGRAVLKADAIMTNNMAGELRQKVISVNKKIHGVYDKIGAASIEKEWWGGLVMQYHKHLYPGIMKRYRTKGYYNEIRSSVEKGSYISLAQLLSVEFDNIGKRINNRANVDNENKAIASFKEIVKSAIDTVVNLKLNYQLMPIWEQNNLKRALGDLLGIASAFMVAMAIHLMTDDDEIKESELLSTALYMADRLNSESAMFTPTGMVAEAGTLWSSPIAAQNGPKDLIKGLGIATGMLFDADYKANYTTGLYKGQNKLAVLAYRNTPIYRVYQRLSTMTKNNNYYKINENALNIKFAKAFADKVNPD